MDPQEPLQPSQQTGLNQVSNPAGKTSAEQAISQDRTSTSGHAVDKRHAHDVPSQHSEEPTSTSLGYGDTGPLKEKDISESNKMNYANSELDGEQMRAPGEGEVAEAVRTGGGGGHAGEGSLTANMDQKAAEHKEILHERGERTGAEIEAEDKEDWTGKKADVGEALGGRDTKVVLAADE